MWLALAFISALFLGFYDVSKKAAVRDNAVLPVLLLNPTFTGERVGGPLQAHLLVVAKAAIVLTSWIFGYTGMKHLPITIVGPINATRPVLVLVGAMAIFGERLNLWQWAGVAFAVVSLLLLSLAGKKEKVDFTHNKWIWCVAAAVVSLVRRGSVVISSLCGAALFREKNLRTKAFDLALILLGMVFIWLGSR